MFDYLDYPIKQHRNVAHSPPANSFRLSRLIRFPILTVYFSCNSCSGTALPSNGLLLPTIDKVIAHNVHEVFKSLEIYLSAVAD